MNNVGHHLLSGGLSGLATTLALQPFDLLKTRLQQREPGDVRRMRNSSVILHTSKEILAQDGIRGLWRGTNAALLRNVPGIAMYMTSLHHIRTVLATSPYFTAVRKQSLSVSTHASVLPSLTNTGNLLAGATTRVAIGFLLNPFSVLKTRYESNLYAYDSLFFAFTSMVRSGPSELFRGFVASSLRDAPYAGLFIFSYEAFKQHASVLMPPDSTASSALLHSLSAASAGTVATLTTHPFDVIKTKVQVRTEDKYHGLMRTIQTIFEQRGLLGFLDGASLRLSRKVLSSAIGWAVYESVLLFMKRRRGTEPGSVA